MGGAFLEVLGEVGEKFPAQAVAVGGEKGEGLVAVAQPPLAIGGFEVETGGLEQVQGGGIAGVLAGGQGDGEVVLGAVNGHARGRGWPDAAGFPAGRRWRRRSWDGYRPEQRRIRPGRRRTVGLNKERLAAGGGDQVAELGAAELDEFRRSGRATPALQKSQDGDHLVGRRGCEVEFHLERHCVADHGGGEIGREMEAEHGCRRKEARE